MPTFDRGHTYVNGEDATEDIFNDPWDALETFLNVTKLDGVNLQNGIITPAMLTTALQQLIGANGGRGKSIIAGEGTRTNVAYGALDAGAAPGPDSVTGVVVPANGIMRIGFRASWKESVENAARAAIFIGSNQLKIAQPNVANPAVQEAGIGVQGSPGDTAGTYRLLHSHPVGLVALNGDTAYAGDVATGQGFASAGYGDTSTYYVGGSLFILDESISDASLPAIGAGGFVEVHGLPAASYDVSVQFKASSGTVSVKERKLWVEAVGF